MTEDLNLVGTDYNNLIVVAFVGYAIFQMIAGFFAGKISPAFYLSGAAFLWGLVSMSCGFVKTKGAMYALRFLVGATEAPFFPGALLIVSVTR